MKSGVRVLGVDDAAFSLEDSATQLVGVVYRGNRFIEDVRISEVEVDGEDGEEAVAELFRSCNNVEQIKAIMLDGISVAGFNVVRPSEVQELTDRAVVSVTANEPDREEFIQTMERAGKETSEKLSGMDRPGEIEMEEGSLYYQSAGLSKEEVEELARNCTLQGLTPEPVRAAHMIGKALKDS